MKNPRMPASSGGIVQYYEEEASKFELSPKQVIFISVILAVTVLILKWTNILGL